MILSKEEREKQRKEFIRESLKASALGITETILIILLFYILKLNIYEILLLLSAYVLYGSVKEGQGGIYFLKHSLALITYVSILLWLNYFLRGWEFWGLLVISLVIALVILFKRRKAFIDSIRLIETQIWGAPLDELRKQDEEKDDGEGGGVVIEEQGGVDERS